MSGEFFGGNINLAGFMGGFLSSVTCVCFSFSSSGFNNNILVVTNSGSVVFASVTVTESPVSQKSLKS